MKTRLETGRNPMAILAVLGLGALLALACATPPPDRLQFGAPPAELKISAGGSVFGGGEVVFLLE